MTWLLEHLTGLAWTGAVWLLILLTLAGSLWRWLHPNATQEDAR
jgi:hypothetical protein